MKQETSKQAETKALNKAPDSKSFCECEHEYGHKWNKKGDRLICVKCEKYV